MEALSLDLRERVCAACDEGMDSRQEVAERFGVSRSFVQKLLQRRREQGSIAAKPHGRDPTPRIGAHWKKKVREVDPSKRVFVDESGVNTAMSLPSV